MRRRVSVMPSIAVLPGDGIGPEVTKVVLDVLTSLRDEGLASVQWTSALIGGAAIDETGEPFPRATAELVHRVDAVFLGAVGGPQWAHAKSTPEKGLLDLRKSLGLFANIRPFTVFEGLEAMSPLKAAFQGGVIIRELLGGLYYGQPRGREGSEAFDTARYGVSEIERTARIGFQMAQDQGVPLVSIDKANVLETSKLWREAVIALGERDFPEVPLYHRYVDAAATELVLAPDHFPVVVTENLFGDILSDLTGGLVGSLGLLGSATVGQYQRGPGLYEPVHGSAPDIAGKHLANPIGALESLAMMLAWSLGLPDASRLVREATRKTIKDGIVTPDVGGKATTEMVTRTVIGHIKEARLEKARGG